ncbi:PD40 domain-containing protein [Fulvivirgaceae bacterium PWU4]|uniref:PD40 domain-containing protein n=1 Tax=Chryseosolibacter histidini TaxID=2782349 RepID=A0AAP2DM69_9BACT|nr:hypothetical protein [Chryseosolibacter histidini]MBT1698044.1 PD40 domain-containing protein [Chryseosolibacter histidini]
MKHLLWILPVWLWVALNCSQPHTVSVPYPPPPPKDSIARFLPGVVCSDGDSIDFNATFSLDGKTFYFTRSRNRSWDIYQTRFREDRWRKPEKVVFDTDQYSEADPAIGPDGFLYFISNMPKDDADTLKDFDIWFVRPQEGGGWSRPENLSVVNTDSTEYYVSFAGDGNLYFASSRVGGFGMEDIYVSRKVNGQYTKPENLGPKINSPYSDHDACLPANEKFMIYTSVDREDGLGEGDLYMSVRNDDGSWQEGRSMGRKWNTPTYEYCAYLSPDGKYFFYSSQRDVKWTPIESLPAELLDALRE